MCRARRGRGANVRRVTLALEAHGQAARERTEQVLYEMTDWFNRRVKNALPRKPGADDREVSRGQ